MLKEYDLYKNPNIITIACQELSRELRLQQFIEQVNKIYASLTTIGGLNYHTFTSLDRFKIIVRCTDENTDIIIINLNPDKSYVLDDIDMEKIALWYQARLFPPKDFIQNPSDNSSDALGNPFDGKSATYCHASYSANARSKDADKFNDSFNRIAGTKANHQTNLYLGYGFTLNLKQFSGIKVVTHLKTERELENEVFERQDNVFNSPLVLFPPKGVNSGQSQTAAEMTALPGNAPNNMAPQS